MAAIIESILTNNPCYQAGRKITVKGLMLHSVGVGQPDATVFTTNWNKESYDRACVHAFIDANSGTVYQTLPWNHRGWHAGGDANSTHIGVEMCEPASIRYTGGASFTCSDTVAAREAVKRTYESAVSLFAMLCGKYSLNPLEDGVILSHYEGGQRGIASGHADPEHLWKGLQMGYTMDSFRKDVADAMNKEEITPKLGEITCINGYRKADSLVLLVGKTSTGFNKYGVDVIFDANGTVTKVVKGQENTAIPAGCYCLSGHGINYSYLLDHYKVGSRIKVL